MELGATESGITRNSCDVIGSARVFRPTRRSVSGVYAFRGSVAVPFESTLERDFLIRAEFFRDVSSVVSQPVSIPFLGVNGQVYEYTPDFLVCFHESERQSGKGSVPVLVEVKPEEEWREHWRSWSSKWKSAGRYARERGWTFRIHDESRIRDQVLVNVRWLERYKRMSFPEGESRRILEGIREAGSMPVARVLAQGFTSERKLHAAAHAWHLLAARRLDCDMSVPLGAETELWVVDHG